MSFRFVAALAGIATAVIGIALVFFPMNGEFPTAAMSATQIASFYKANGGPVIAQSVGSALLFILITVFGAGLWSTLRDAERERGEAWSVVGLLGATATSATYTVGSAAVLALARTAAAAPSGGDAAIVALFNLQDTIYQLGTVFLVIYLVGFSLAGQRERAMPTWLSWIGYVSALFVATGLVSAIAPTAVPAYGFYIGSFGFLVWTLIASIRLLRSSAPRVARAPEPGYR